VVILARTAAAFQRLLALLEAGDVEKEYLAGCDSSARPVAAGERLAITSRFAPWGPGRRKVRVVEGERVRHGGRHETTAVEYSTAVEVLVAAPGWCSARCSIARGFRHQVRAHLAHLRLPILGDPLYGAAAPPGFPPRMCLHAAAVTLPHPRTGARLRIESPLPPELRLLLP
jgi:23S rRNA pseudouridine1911/1915/1917 synthase